MVAQGTLVPINCVHTHTHTHTRDGMDTGYYHLFFFFFNFFLFYLPFHTKSSLLKAELFTVFQSFITLE